MSDCKINNLEHYLSLWKGVHQSREGEGWNHFLPYYHKDIYFKDTIQEIKGIREFTKMVERLSKRSRDLKAIVHNSVMNGQHIFIEWEMIISYKKLPKTSIHGLSRVTLKDGKILEQRDYYDLWGDIYDNIIGIRRVYRFFMRKLFG